MSGFSKAERKILLADPVAAYRERNPSPDSASLTEIEQISTELNSLNDNIKSLDDDRKGLSRQIGQAKAAGEPIEPLKAKVKTLSEQLKQLASTQKSREEQLLEFFANDTESTKSQQEKAIPRYRLAQIRPQEITIDTLSEDTQAWDTYVAQNSHSSIYHLSAWRDLVKTTFGHTAHYLQARGPENNVLGVLPLIRLNSRLFGDFLVSMPYFNYGGAIADHPEIEQLLINQANQYATTLGVSHIEYRDDIPREGMPVRSEKVNMLLKLPDSIEALWNGFTPKLRAQIKRPQRENPDIRVGKAELLNDFYAVFSRNMRDLGTPVYGRYFFEAILKTFEEHCWIVSVRLNGKPVAAGFLMGYRDRLEIPWASSRQDMNHLSVNMLLYWSVLQHAVSQGFKIFDFGRSSIDSGTYRFKRQWGAEPKQSYWHYWLREGEALPAINPTNKKYALMINTWKRLPVALTKLIGPPIIKNIP